MNQLQILMHKEFGEVRFVGINEKVFAVGNDVARALGYSRPHEAISAHCKGAVNYRILTDGGKQEMRVIPEGDIFRLIVKAADQSVNPAIREIAERFEKWIYDEVLPSIRKTGSYVEKPKTQAELMVMYAKQFVEMEKRVEQMETKVTTIQETFMNHDEDWRNMINGLMKGASFSRGGDYRELRTLSYKMLEERGRCDLNIRLRNLKRRLQEEGHTKTKINKTSRMDVIENEPRLKEIYTIIVKELSIGALEVV